MLTLSREMIDDFAHGGCCIYIDDGVRVNYSVGAGFFVTLKGPFLYQRILSWCARCDAPTLSPTHALVFINDIYQPFQSTHVTVACTVVVLGCQLSHTISSTVFRPCTLGMYATVILCLVNVFSYEYLWQAYKPTMSLASVASNQECFFVRIFC